MYKIIRFMPVINSIFDNWLIRADLPDRNKALRKDIAKTKQNKRKKKQKERKFSIRFYLRNFVNIPCLYHTIENTKPLNIRRYILHPTFPWCATLMSHWLSWPLIFSVAWYKILMHSWYTTEYLTRRLHFLGIHNNLKIQVTRIL